MHVVSPEEEKERLRWEGIAEKEGLSLESLFSCRQHVARLTT